MKKQISAIFVLVITVGLLLTLSACGHAAEQEKLSQLVSNAILSDNVGERSAEGHKNGEEYYLLDNQNSAAVPSEQGSTDSEPPALTLHETASLFTCAYISQDIDAIRHFLSSDFEGDPKDVSPWSRTDMFKIKGADDETIDSADGQKIVSVEFQNPDYPDSFVYLTIGLVKENDEWRVRWYGLEG